MRFVKASDKLSPIGKMVNALYKGEPATVFYSETFASYYDSSGACYPVKEVEWLDMSEQDEGWVPVSSQRKNFMRQQAVAAKELLKGFIPEQRENFSNATKTVDEFADYILELTNPAPPATT